MPKLHNGVLHSAYITTHRCPWTRTSFLQRKLVTPEDVEDVRREIQIMNHLSGHK